MFFVLVLTWSTLKQITSKYINSLKSNTKKSNATEKQFVAGVLMCYIAGKSFLKIPKGIT